MVINEYVLVKKFMVHEKEIGEWYLDVVKGFCKCTAKLIPYDTS